MFSVIEDEVWYAEGSRERFVVGEGVSVNIIDRSGPSSVATRVSGTGLLENFGIEASLESVSG